MSKKSTKSKKSSFRRAKIPHPAKFVRRPNPTTGNLPRIKVFGIAFDPEDLVGWAAERNVLQKEALGNREFGSLQMIMGELPDSFRWGVVTPHHGDLVKMCIIIGSNESQQTMSNAYNPLRAEVVQDVLGTQFGEPKWYFLREDFEYDS
ncbi:hypothetical protein GALMADRAFT_143892 [Galerina marginata CBS 339.88]|uniref:Uncharacterized protein n=1 Tax=Galerina marginata (strain CBS 339.88) TaxID=685588 RepID=A0A067SL10_GALM3|nr:hypothetical protein GALMADRAFT_143892 [Galerina marginata CBS 339.88]